jgi:hypothetical protein
MSVGLARFFVFGRPVAGFFFFLTTIIRRISRCEYSQQASQSPLSQQKVAFSLKRASLTHLYLAFLALAFHPYELHSVFPQVSLYAAFQVNLLIVVLLVEFRVEVVSVLVFCRAGEKGLGHCLLSRKVLRSLVLFF